MVKLAVDEAEFFLLLQRPLGRRACVSVGSRRVAINVGHRRVELVPLGTNAGKVTPVLHVRQDDDHCRVIDAPTRHNHPYGGELLDHATQLAGWGVGEVRPSPTALHERVDLQAQGWARFVQAQEIPRYARIELKTRYPPFKATAGKTFPESDWLEFLQG